MNLDRFKVYLADEIHDLLDQYDTLGRALPRFTPEEHASIYVAAVALATIRTWPPGRTSLKAPHNGYREA